MTLHSNSFIIGYFFRWLNFFFLINIRPIFAEGVKTIDTRIKEEGKTPILKQFSFFFVVFLCAFLRAIDQLLRA